MGAFIESDGDHPRKSNGTTVTIPKQKHEKISTFQAASHLFKGSVGAGIFAMGDCYKNGGLVGATLLMLILAVIVVHCEHLLINGSVRAVEKTPGATFLDYPRTAQKCFEYGPKSTQRLAKAMKLIVEIFLFITQFGFCAILLGFTTQNIHQVLLENGLNIRAYTVSIVLLLLVMIPSLMTTLKLIAPVSFLASLFLMFGILATLSIAVWDDKLAPISQRNEITNARQMALCFGTAQFAFEGIAVILPLRNSMKEPEKFVSPCGVLNTTIIFIAILFIFTGAITYLRWGDHVASIITLNLIDGSIFSQSVKIIAACGVFFGYPIQFMVLIKTLWPPILNASTFVQKHSTLFQVLFRFVLVLLTFAAALVIPNLGLFISLIGAFCATSLAIVIPVLIDFVTKAQTTKELNFFVWIKNIVLLLIAFFGIILGTYQSLVDIIIAYNVDKL